MDPDVNLTEQIQLAQKIASTMSDHSPEDIERLAELVLALDEWIRNDGGLPVRWDTVGEQL